MERREIPRRTNSEAHKGIFPSEETRKRMGNSHRGKRLGKKGHPPWSAGLTKETDPRLMRISQRMTGRHVTNETREKLSKARIGKYGGENHPNWQGGLKDNPYGIEFNERLRQQIRERDGLVCQICNGADEERALQVHHINYDKIDNRPVNLISLCLRCHVKTNFNRDAWIGFFTKLISARRV